jgi:hypothetical protein
MLLIRLQKGIYKKSNYELFNKQMNMWLLREILSEY